jgi:phosphate transport system substrate-binding protein
MRDRLKRIFTAYSALSFALVAGLTLTAALPLIGKFPFTNNFYYAGLMWVVVPLLAGWLWAGKSSLPDTLFARFMPLLLPPLLLLLAYIPFALAGDPIVSEYRLIFTLVALGTPYCFFYLAFLVRSELRGRSTAKLRGAVNIFGVMLVGAYSAVAAHQAAIREIIPPGAEVFIERGVNTRFYRPFSKDNWLEQSASTPSLRISSEHPKLDGAIAVYPLYAAFAQAVYAGMDEKNIHEVVRSSSYTERAYQRLIDGQSDIFFGAAPSPEQRDYAATKRLHLTEIPIGKEAFVFFVHMDNPVRSLSLSQIKAVYSGRIRNWKAFGGLDEPILAFQWPEDSESQTTMLRLMEGEILARPPREKKYDRYNVFLDVASYRNLKNALGYYFRWETTVIFANIFFPNPTSVCASWP